MATTADSRVSCRAITRTHWRPSIVRHSLVSHRVVPRRRALHAQARDNLRYSRSTISCCSFRIRMRIPRLPASASALCSIQERTSSELSSQHSASLSAANHPPLRSSAPCLRVITNLQPLQLNRSTFSSPSSWSSRALLSRCCNCFACARHSTHGRAFRSSSSSSELMQNAVIRSRSSRSIRQQQHFCCLVAASSRDVDTKRARSKSSSATAAHPIRAL